MGGFARVDIFIPMLFLLVWVGIPALFIVTVGRWLLIQSVRIVHREWTRLEQARE